MKDPAVTKQSYPYAGALTFGNVRAKSSHEGLNIAPLNAARNWTGEYQLKRSQVLAIHG